MYERNGRKYRGCRRWNKPITTSYEYTNSMAVREQLGAETINLFQI